jgi:long-chain fatty acid transport protein
MIRIRMLSASAPVIAGSLLVAGSPASLASGFAVPEISIAGLALANAMVANTSDAGALPYNPAAMAFLGDASAGGGLMIIGPTNKVSNTLFNEGESFDTEGSDWILSGMAHGHIAMSDQLALGLSVNSPFGLEIVWPSEAFADGFAAAGAAGQEPTRSKLELVSASPSISYRINDEAAIAAGFDLYWIRDIKFNTTANIICCGTGTGTGFHLSGLFRRGDWSFGASYFSSADVDLDDGKVSGIEAEATIDLPWRAQVGVHYQATDAIGVEFDITRTGWSKFDKLEIFAADGFTNAALGGPLVTSTNDWDDANAYRLGVTWALSDKTRLRFGYSYDETPQDDDHFSARIPDNDRHLFGVGFSHELGDSGWDIEGGYMYVALRDRSLDLPPPTSSEPNGTSLYDGDYEADVHLVGLGISKRF